MKSTRALAVLFLILTLPFSSIAFADGSKKQEFSTFYVFGDSLSDPGNVYTLIGTTATAPFDPIPSAPYQGSFRFTNGKTWIERVARLMGVPKGGKPAFRKPGKFGNYALGGSRAGPSDNPLFTFGGQVGTFLTNVGGTAPADALYVVWFGGNDVRDALTAAATDPTFATSQAIIAAAVQAEAQAIAQLHAAGARKFLVLNAPNVSLVPGVTSQGPLAIAGALQLSVGFNTALSGALDGLEFALPGIEIYRFDVFSLVSELAANPLEFRFTNATDACLSFFVVQDAVCNKPNRYVFWDAIHPTKATHRLLGNEVKAFLRSLPAD